MDTNDTVETIVENEAELSTGKILVFCAAALAVGVGTKLLVDRVRTKLAERKTVEATPEDAEKNDN